jgi:hypothetical protein
MGLVEVDVDIPAEHRNVSNELEITKWHWKAGY